MSHTSNKSVKKNKLENGYKIKSFPVLSTPILLLCPVSQQPTCHLSLPPLLSPWRLCLRILLLGLRVGRLEHAGHARLPTLSCSALVMVQQTACTGPRHSQAVQLLALLLWAPGAGAPLSAHTCLDPAA